METRIAIIGIFVYKIESAYKINELLHEYNQYIIVTGGTPFFIKKCYNYLIIYVKIEIIVITVIQSLR